MSASLGSRFEIAPDGRPLHQQPLDECGFRFNVSSGTWRERGGLKRGAMPRVISRANISKTIGVSEDIIQRWEEATKAPGNQLPPPEDLMAIDDSGRPVHREPFLQYGFAFYPRSSTWRRTRADRTEVPRDVVAKKLGVAEQQLARWEVALRNST